MDKDDYQNVTTAILKLEKAILHIKKRLARHQMMLSVPQENEEREIIEKMQSGDYKKLMEAQETLEGIKWLLE